MSQTFISQVMAFGFNYAPKNWALCNGQIMAIQQNTALFSLLGTTYGGNGTTTFALPNLQSRVALHPDNATYFLGEMDGVENVTITSSTMAAHNHGFFGTTENATKPAPDTGAALSKIYAGTATPDNYYAADTTFVGLNPGSVSIVGGNQSHTNIQPYLTISWCICIFGIYPARN
jgi:microcystin-dependent protein